MSIEKYTSPEQSTSSTREVFQSPEDIQKQTELEQRQLSEEVAQKNRTIENNTAVFNSRVIERHPLLKGSSVGCILEGLSSLSPLSKSAYGPGVIETNASLQKIQRTISKNLQIPEFYKGKWGPKVLEKNITELIGILAERDAFVVGLNTFSSEAGINHTKTQIGALAGMIFEEKLEDLISDEQLKKIADSLSNGVKKITPEKLKKSLSKAVNSKTMSILKTPVTKVDAILKSTWEKSGKEITKGLQKLGYNEAKINEIRTKKLPHFFKNNPLGKSMAEGLDIAKQSKNAMFSPAGIIIMAITLHDSEDPQEAFLQYASFVTAGNVVMKSGKLAATLSRPLMSLIKTKVPGSEKLAQTILTKSPKGLGSLVALAAVIGILMYPPFAKKISQVADWTDDQISDGGRLSDIINTALAIIDSPITLIGNLITQTGFGVNIRTDKDELMERYTQNEIGGFFDQIQNSHLGKNVYDALDYWNHQVNNKIQDAKEQGNTAKIKLYTSMLVSDSEEWKLLNASEIIQLGNKIEKREQKFVQKLQNLGVLRANEGLDYFMYAKSDQDFSSSISVLKNLQGHIGRRRLIDTMADYKNPHGISSMRKVNQYFNSHMDSQEGGTEFKETVTNTQKNFDALKAEYEELKTLTDSFAKKIDLAEHLGVYDREEWFDNEEASSILLTTSIVKNAQKREEAVTTLHQTEGSGVTDAKHSDEIVDLTYHDTRGWMDQLKAGFVFDEKDSALRSEKVQLGLLVQLAIQRLGVDGESTVESTNRVLYDTYKHLSNNHKQSPQAYAQLTQQILGLISTNPDYSTPTTYQSIAHHGNITQIQQINSKGKVPNEVSRYFNINDYRNLYDADNMPFVLDKNGNKIYDTVELQGGRGTTTEVARRKKPAFNYPTITKDISILKNGDRRTASGNPDTSDWKVLVRYSMDNHSPYGHGGSVETHQTFTEEVSYHDWLNITGNKSLQTSIESKSNSETGNKDILKQINKGQNVTRHSDPTYIATTLDIPKGTSKEMVNFYVQNRIETIQLTNKFKEIRHTTHNAEHVSISREDTSKNIEAYKKNGSWEIQLQGKYIGKFKNFDQAVMLSSLLLHIDTITKDWKSGDGENPFHTDSDDSRIDFNKKNTYNPRTWQHTSVLEDRLDYYAEKIGISSQEISGYLNTLWGIVH